MVWGLIFILAAACNDQHNKITCPNWGKPCNDNNQETFQDRFGDDCECKGTVVEFKPGSGVTDVEGRHYTSFVLQDQEWMQQDLQVKSYNNGDPIPMIEEADQWEAYLKGAGGAIQKNQADEWDVVYNWYAVVDDRGLCPTGWHVPSFEEWEILVDHCGGDSYAGDHLLLVSRQSHPEPDKENAAGFAAELGGIRDYMGEYFNVGQSGYWWSSSNVDSIRAKAVAMTKCSSGVTMQLNGHKREGLKLRCVKNVK
jgi:uncharacterized protein (TIGR02145 family)